jgi:UDP-N-acetylglucosamine acyltransferase
MAYRLDDPYDKNLNNPSRSMKNRDPQPENPSRIHPTAVIDPGAVIAEDASIGPFCYVGPHATIGSQTRLVSHVSVLGRTTLGANNTVWPQVTLGADPQDLKYRGEDSQLIIGDRNDIREGVTIHLGTQNGGGLTRLGSHNLLMVGSHVAHDCLIGNHVILANAVHLAGHVLIEDHAVISGASAVHHYVTIGKYAFIGGMTRIVHDVPPFVIIEGNPAKIRGVNTIGLKRHSFPDDSITRLKDAHRRLFKKTIDPLDGNPEPGNLTENLAKLEADYPQDQLIETLVDFLKRASTGLYGRFRETERSDNRRCNPVR